MERTLLDEDCFTIVFSTAALLAAQATPKKSVTRGQSPPKWPLSLAQTLPVVFSRHCAGHATLQKRNQRTETV